MDNALHYTSVSHADHVIQAVNKLWRRKELCDIDLVIDQHKIPAHRLILVACTPYFHSLLQLHSKQNPREIYLNGVDWEAVETVVEFFYTSAISVHEENVWTILPVACLLQVEEIKTLCCDFLKSQMNVENCLKCRKIAVRCLCAGLQKESEKFIKANFSKILQEDSFKELEYEEFASYIGEVLPGTLSETELEYTVDQWFNYNTAARSKYLSHIAERLPFLKEKFKDYPLEDMNASDGQETNGTDRELSRESLQSSSENLSSSVKDENDKFLICVMCGEVSETEEQHKVHMEGHERLDRLQPIRRYIRSQNYIDTNNESCSITTRNEERVNHLPTPVPQNASDQNFMEMKSESCPMNITGHNESLTIQNLPNNNYVHTKSEPCPVSLQNILAPSISLTPLPPPNLHPLSPPFPPRFQPLHPPPPPPPPPPLGGINSEQLFCHVCPMCGKNFPDRTKLGKHIKTHSVGAFMCTVCDKSYSTKSNLQVHMRTHTGERPFVCPYCRKGFGSYCILKVHIRTHTGEKPFQCFTCGVAFAKKIHLKRHTSIHTGEKPHRCDMCGKHFSRSDHLKRHIQSIHSKNKPHVCHVCRKDFVRKYELNKHLQHHWTAVKPVEKQQ